MKRKKVEGGRATIVLGGGVGPLAGILLHQSVIRHTPNVRTDPDHIDVWHVSTASRLPDRTAFLLGEEILNPAEEMARNICAVTEVLVGRGESCVVAIPCATFHAPPIFSVFERIVRQRMGFFHVVHLVGQTISHLAQLPMFPRKIGVLSTKGSWQLGVWRDPLFAAGFEVVELDSTEIDELHAAIYDPSYGLKATHAPTRRAEQVVLSSSRCLLERGAQALILGCTELPFVVGAVRDEFGSTLVVCDPIEVQAKALVSAALFPSTLRSE